ncbi:hypothetical protein DPMN_145881 [Dreissena polymorpha]|uniref:SET domain-containing protein n=1 Tax=Dreissena polymorpha TaxID=45954 RepID=A0A9D4F4W9_DREPO|nr:hypothetical protein DPMN_145881 [Dreissena polymorpha]
MVNDAIKGDIRNNAEMKIVLVHGKPHLCLFATKDISVNEELRFNYGVPNLRWRKADQDMIHELENDARLVEQSQAEVEDEEDMSHKFRKEDRPVEQCQAEVELMYRRHTGQPRNHVL